MEIMMIRARWFLAAFAALTFAILADMHDVRKLAVTFGIICAICAIGFLVALRRARHE